MPKKERLTVTVDANLLEAANEAVAAGRAESLSSWVNLALAEREAKERRLRAMAEAVADYEAQFGEITPEEIAAQQRADQRAAIIVRGPRRARTRPTRPRGRAA
jgi:Arc/MetJ-type ribon-helix-helix transcriptional regulator